MLFPTVDYGLFFLAAFAGAWALRRQPVAHKTLLLALSYAFYAFWDWRFLPLLVGISAVGAAVAAGLQRLTSPGPRRVLLALGITLCLLTLGVFKYLGFLTASLLGVLAWLGLQPGAVRLPEIALPVGVSFFVFHAISLMVDAYRGQIAVKVRPLDALLYVAFFPQLVAGPILRASTFLPQLQQSPDPGTIDAARALELIATGLFKKVLIAQFLATQVVDPVFESPAAHPGLAVLLAVYGYAVQIYCDFSGYTDLAIGSALLLGYRIPPNFDRPYSAASPQEFWRRWHLSLSSWLRDYLFIPLGGSRGGQPRTLANLAVTMILGGLWHGAAWTFVVWGAFHGVWLCAHRLWQQAVPARFREHPRWRPVAVVLTFHAVCLGWVIFRATSLPNAQEVLAALGQGGAVPAIWLAIVLAISAGLLGHLLGSAGWATGRARFARLPLVLQGVVFALAVLCLEALGPRGIAPFIYFRF